MDEQLSRWLRVAALLAVLISAVLFTRNFVVWNAPLDLSVYSMWKSGHPNGAQIAGIEWNDHLTDLRVIITDPTADDYDNLDLKLKPEGYTYKAALLGDVGGCTLISAGGDVLAYAIASKSGNLTITAHPLGGGVRTDFQDSSGDNFIQIGNKGGYRVRCETFPKHFSIEIVFALVAPARDLGPIESGFTVEELRGVKNFFDLMAPRPLPGCVSISGGYARRHKPIRVSRCISVAKDN